MGQTTTELRQHIFKIFDKILKTGRPYTVARKDRELRIQLVPKQQRFARLTKRELTVEPDSYYEHIDWSKEWKEGK